MYLSKYLKYKMKYLLLSESQINKIDYIKQKRGGSQQIINFETLFSHLVEFIINYNKKKIANDLNLFGMINLFQIKGGSSIKYHLMQRGIDTTNLTSDIDLLFFSDDLEEVEKEIIAFYKELQKTFPSLAWNYNINNGLVTIKIGGGNIIDISVYDPNFDMDDETSMFAYALKKLGFKNIKEYYDKITTSDNIEEITFTSLEFEFFSSQKGIEVIQGYLNAFPSWQASLRYFTQKQIEIETKIPIDDKELENVKRIIKGYTKQLSPEYIDNLRNKLERYKRKNEIINSILNSKN
ncbi:hypothetical protein CPAV1605_140 [seawater metagenome]|uniref:Uncharacterized protein n=1 Tax=seawater metagenome TaxID=1561972 RepID=A0A5E8CG79_9ZZZZ